MEYYDIDGKATTLFKLIRLEPDWAANRIQHLERLVLKREKQLKEMRAAYDSVIDQLESTGGDSEGDDLK